MTNKQTVTKRNAQDSTLRNVRAASKRLAAIEARLSAIEARLDSLEDAAAPNTRQRST